MAVSIFVVWPTLLLGHLPVRFHEVLLGNSLFGWVSTDLFCLGHTILPYNTVPLSGVSLWQQCKGINWLAGSPSISGAVIRRCLW